jgi:hypothetical protein
MRLLGRARAAGMTCAAARRPQDLPGEPLAWRAQLDRLSPPAARAPAGRGGAGVGPGASGSSESRRPAGSKVRSLTPRALSVRERERERA